MTVLMQLKTSPLAALSVGQLIHMTVEVGVQIVRVPSVPQLKCNESNSYHSICLK